MTGQEKIQIKTNMLVLWKLRSRLPSPGQQRSSSPSAERGRPARLPPLLPLLWSEGWMKRWRDVSTSTDPLSAPSLLPNVSAGYSRLEREARAAVLDGNGCPPPPALSPLPAFNKPPSTSNSPPLLGPRSVSSIGCVHGSIPLTHAYWLW